MRTTYHCEGVGHYFGDNRILFDVNMVINPGEFVSVVGPSGCGKSTLLRALLGTHPAKEGVVEARKWREDGIMQNRYKINRPNASRGIVYQRYSLFPHLTAVENVTLGLILKRTSIPYRMFRHFKYRQDLSSFRKEASTFLDRVGLSHVIDRYPSEMSGGQCQRVAIAQACIMKPHLLLLDEPFGALDESTREKLQKMLLALSDINAEERKKGNVPIHTLMLVTHELNEAIYVGDRVIGLSQYWDWKTKYPNASKCPGATVVYDKPAPVYKVSDSRDFEIFAAQRDEIRAKVFEPAKTATPLKVA